MPLVPNPNIPQFENAGAAFFTEMRSRYAIIALLLLPFIVGIILSIRSQTPESAIFGILPLAFFLIYRYNKHKGIFMRQFGSLYGFTYVGTEPVTERYASKFFSQGHARQIEHLLRGTYHDHPIELFHYKYTTGSGKNQTTHPYTVCIIDFAGMLPAFAIRENKFLNGDRIGDGWQRKLTLEGPFSKKFEVYVTEDHEIEVLQVLTPEIMEWLIEKGGSYSFEFKGHRLYLIENDNLLDRKTLANLIEFGGEIIDRLGTRLARLHDDVAAIHEAKNA